MATPITVSMPRTPAIQALGVVEVGSYFFPNSLSYGVLANIGAGEASEPGKVPGQFPGQVPEEGSGAGSGREFREGSGGAVLCVNQ